MSITIEKEVDYDFGFDIDKVIADVINETIDYMACPYDAEVNVTITDDSGIHEINKEYRDIDKATDVLSFPLVDYKEPGNLEIAESSVSDYFNPETGELMLGDIIFSAERAKAQSIEYGHSLKREAAFLVAHSMLHLFGFDHMEEDERIVMEQKQREILDKLGINR